VLILGIIGGSGCGAAIVVDGRLLAAVNEEALCRLKMAEGFPHGSIAEVMPISGVASRDIDLVCAATVNSYWTDGVRPYDGWFSGRR
jgi:carbamoyltransferase